MSLWRKNEGETEDREGNKCLLRGKREQVGVEKA